MFGWFNRNISISTIELNEKINGDIRLLDVRTPGEYRAGHISKAQNVPLDKIENYKNKKEQKIYVICQSGMRSKKAARILQKKGYDVVNVRGGMNQWQGKVQGGR